MVQKLNLRSQRMEMYIIIVKALSVLLKENL